MCFKYMGIFLKQNIEREFGGLGELKRIFYLNNPQ